MPDWSYQTLFRPLLFRLPAEAARDLTLRAVGSLAALPFGPAALELFGHLRPPAGLKRWVGGVTFATPVGLGAGLDPHLLGLAALARFGVGFLEVGPVTEAPLGSSHPVRRDVAAQAIVYPDQPVNDGAAALIRRLERLGPLPVPLGFRLAHRPGAGPEEALAERLRLVARLAPFAAWFAVETRGGAAEGRWSNQSWAPHLAGLRETLAGVPMFVCLPPDLPEGRLEPLLQPAAAAGVSAVVVGGGIATGNAERTVGLPSQVAALEQVRRLRARPGERLAIIGSGGILDPAAALNLLAAGADAVQVHSGLVYAGHGLPKRINEAVAYFDAAQPAPPPVRAGAFFPPGWVWIALLGLGMMVGGALAWLVAATRIILPYDEAFVGLSRAEINAVNERLLHFMAHDRVTLAGTMLTIGVLYWQMAWHGLRQGQHWAWKAVRLSAALGFASFFLFLGFGYFDPLHALVTSLLFPLFLVGLLRPLPPPRFVFPNLRSDTRWRLGLWGQLTFVAIGFGLVGAGTVIAGLGVTQVFVAEDLAFLRTTPAALHAANPRLVPLIAHDRAGLGGTLASAGLAVMFLAAWGYREGHRWIWWTLAAAGLPGFVAAFGVHLVVGYTDLLHLAPALLALGLYGVGLALSYPYLCAPVMRPGRVAAPIQPRPAPA